MGRDVLPLDATIRMLEGFVKGVMERGKDKLGEKTIIDSLLPALEALRSAPAPTRLCP